MCLYVLHDKHIRTKIMQTVNKYLDHVSWEVYRSEESGRSLIRAEQVVEAGNCAPLTEGGSPLLVSKAENRSSRSP
jgi:hypothetical protein